MSSAGARSSPFYIAGDEGESKRERAFGEIRRLREKGAEKNRRVSNIKEKDVEGTDRGEAVSQGERTDSRSKSKNPLRSSRISKASILVQRLSQLT